MSMLMVLGAPDPEMEAIEALAKRCNIPIAYATVNGKRCQSRTAFRCDGYTGADAAPGSTLVCVECTLVDVVDLSATYNYNIVSIDHHRPGDPGYCRPPAEFLPASSIGQVLSLLALDQSVVGGVFARPHYDMNQDHTQALCGEFRLSPQNGWWLGLGAVHGRRFGNYIPPEIVYMAAADHCLGAAYRGECPGVNPGELLKWRVAQQAAFRRKSCRDCDGTQSVVAVVVDCPTCTEVGILASIKRARDALLAAPSVRLGWSGYTARDMRGQHVPELPEAGTCYDISYIADGLPDADGLSKVVCSGRHEVIISFMYDWGPINGLSAIYGDPARGFAGGYKASMGPC